MTRFHALRSRSANGVARDEDAGVRVRDVKWPELARERVDRTGDRVGVRYVRDSGRRSTTHRPDFLDQ